MIVLCIKEELLLFRLVTENHMELLFIWGNFATEKKRVQENENLAKYE